MSDDEQDHAQMWDSKDILSICDECQQVFWGKPEHMAAASVPRCYNCDTEQAEIAKSKIRSDFREVAIKLTLDKPDEMFYIIGFIASGVDTQYLRKITTKLKRRVRKP